MHEKVEKGNGWEKKISLYKKLKLINFFLENSSKPLSMPEEGKREGRKEEKKVFTRKSESGYVGGKICVFAVTELDKYPFT